MKNKNILIGIITTAVLLMMFACSMGNIEDTIEDKELYRIQVGGKCGFINEKGKLIIDPQFDNAFWFFGDSVCYAQIGNQNGLINMQGEFVVNLDTAINWVYEFEKGNATFRTKSGKFGIINKWGEIILPACLMDMLRDDYGFIAQDTLGKSGYVNKYGEFIVPCKYDEVGPYSEGRIVVKTGEKYGYVDSLGTWVIDSIFDEARTFGDGLARVKINDKWKFIDIIGKYNDNNSFDEILTGFSCNRAFVENNNKINLIDRESRFIAQLEVDSVKGFRNGLAPYKKNGKWGIVDSMGIEVIHHKFDDIILNGNYIIFKDNDKYGVRDTVGNNIIDALYSDLVINDSLSLILCVNDNWKDGVYYDKSGKMIWRDMTSTKVQWPQKATKEGYIKYIDSRLADLDPIEGIYYVTFNNIAVDRRNDHTTSNGSESSFLAILRYPENSSEFVAFIIDENESGCWAKKFVQVGQSNVYAVVNLHKKKEYTTWAEDDKLIMEDPFKFEITLRQDGNNYYNWYVKCEFIKDYPTVDVFEQVQKAEWSGTGFAIADGYIATNYHVTNGAKTIYIKGVNGNNDESYKGYLVASDREHDISIVKIVDKKFNGFDEIPYSVGKSIPDVGDDIFVLGYPMTETMGKDIKLTDGIISATSGYKGNQSMYQISAAVQPGNSGGPLFDNDGNVIGIVCAKHADAENANYAIKVSYLLSLIKSSDIGIKLPEHNNVKSKSLPKKVKIVKPFVYLIECSSH